MFKKTGTTYEDSEDFVDFPRKVKDIEAAVFFREDEKMSFKLSLRSKGRVNVEKIAKSFGGGGHFSSRRMQDKRDLAGSTEIRFLKQVRKANKGCKMNYHKKIEPEDVIPAWPESSLNRFRSSGMTFSGHWHHLILPNTWTSSSPSTNPKTSHPRTL